MQAGTSTTSGQSSTTLFYPLAPISTVYDPAKNWSYSFQVAGTNSNVLITLSLPAFATEVPVNVFVTSLSSPEEVSRGQISLRIEFYRVDNGAPVKSLSAPLEIRYWSQYAGYRIFLLDQDGVQTEVMRGLSGQDVQFQVPIYVLNFDGSYSVFSRNLSDFLEISSNLANPTTPRIKVLINKPRERGRVYLIQSSPQQKLMIDLPKEYSGKIVQLEVRKYIPKGITYTKLISLVLNTQGDATYNVRNPLLTGDRVRIRIGTSTVLYADI